MMAHKERVSPGMAQKSELLQSIYAVYSRWIERFPLVCRKGCADCCTQSVSMSTLEGSIILDFIKKKNKEKWLREKFSLAAPNKGKATITMNQFAGACIKQQETDGDCSGSWDFTPCIFLEHWVCTIYEVRPFGCRSFGSLVRCGDAGAAEVAPIHLAVNTVFTQLIEHLSSDGGYWANMADILGNLLDMKEAGSCGNLLPAQPIPGFLLEPVEKKIVHALLLQINGQSAARHTFGDLIDNFMSI